MNTRTERKYFPTGRLPGEWYSEKDGHYHWEGTDKNTGERRKLNRKNLDDLRNKKELILQAWENNTSASNLGKTLNDIFPDFLESIQGKKQSTQSLYKRTYARYIKDGIGKSRLTDIKTTDIVNCLNRLYFTLGLSKNLAETTNIVLAGLFKTAKRKNIYSGDIPTAGAMAEIYEHNRKLRSTVQQEIIDGETVKVKDVVPHRIQKKVALNIEDVKHYAEALKIYDVGFFPAFMVLFGTGVRASELAGLQWSDVDFENGTLTVARNIKEVDVGEAGQKMKTKLVLSSPKNGRARVIPLTPEILEALKLQKEMTKTAKRVETCGLNDFIFLTRKTQKANGGRPLVRSNLGKRLKRLTESLELKTGEQFPTFTPHIARHTFITRMNEFGVPQDVAVYVAGHTPKEITARVYTHNENNTRIRDEFDRFYQRYSILEGVKN